MHTTNRWAGIVLSTMALTAVTVVLPTAPRAVACSNEGSTAGSVDGRQLAYDASGTYYQNEVDAADRDWSALGSIDVRPDSAGVYADVNVMDAYEETADWSGLWTATVGSHEIHLNNHFLKGYSLYKRQAVVEHEFGHALKLGHRNDRYALMYCYDDGRVPNTPARSDIAQYRSYWG